MSVTPSAATSFNLAHNFSRILCHKIRRDQPIGILGYTRTDSFTKKLLAHFIISEYLLCKEDFGFSAYQVWQQIPSFQHDHVSSMWIRRHHTHVVPRHCINGNSPSQWRRQNLTPTEWRWLNRLPKKLAQLITSGRWHPMPNFVQIHPR